MERFQFFRLSRYFSARPPGATQPGHRSDVLAESNGQTPGGSLQRKQEREQVAKILRRQRIFQTLRHEGNLACLV